MLRNEIKSGKYFAVACLTILMIFFFGIVCRIIIRQVVVKKLGISNAFTTKVFWDAEELNKLPQNSVERVEIDWQKEYAFNENKVSTACLLKINTWQRQIDSAKKKLEDYTGRFLPGRLQIAQGAEHYTAFLNWQLDRNRTNTGVFYLQNGYMAFYQPKLMGQDIQEIADSVQDFQGWLAERNIPFLYTNAGSKVNPLDKQMSASQSIAEYTNENGDALQNALSERNIDYLDMREEIHRSGLDWYASFYKYDHHWKTETGMWAAGIIAEKLNRDYGFQYDKKYFQPKNYIADTYSWEGSQWRTLYTTLGIDCQGETYTYFLPKFSTQFVVEVPTKGIHKEGEYKDTLFNMEIMEKNRHSTDEEAVILRDAYANTTWANDALGIFKNQLPVNNNKRLLVLQDSFGWYLTTYLACDTAEIDVIHPMAFDGSIRSYIEKFQPDMVLVILCERNISKIDWSKHNSSFDFR